MGRKVGTDSIADIFKGLFMINSPSPPSPGREKFVKEKILQGKWAKRKRKVKEKMESKCVN
jgi:hypothetical protein